MEDNTLWCGNLSNRVTEELLYELFLQAGPLEKVRLPMDAAGYPRSYAFITFKHECSVQYATALFSKTKLFDRPLVIKNAKNSRTHDISLPNIRGRPIEQNSWAAIKEDKERINEHFNRQIPSNGSDVPDFDLIMAMGNQMMYPPSLPMPNLPVPETILPHELPHYNHPDQYAYPSQMRDPYRSRSQRDHSNRNYNHYHPYDSNYSDRYSKESHRDYKRYSNNRESPSSSSHHSRERHNKHR
uniref:RRM domain-containing protein n=2 Tax=Clastoptera arizonana TaxID=38151 RepID=A0A1B6DBJ6_9HEMI